MESNAKIGQRALQMVANSLFPDPFYPNEDLEGCDVPCLKPNQVQIHGNITVKGKKATVCTAKYKGSYIAVKEYFRGKGKVVHEYRVLKSNDSVPCVPKAHGIVYRNGVGVQLAMQYVCSAGGGMALRLDEVVSSEFKLFPKEWLHIFHNVAIALDGLHRNKFIHNNINPMNILIYQREENQTPLPMLIGFGSCTLEKYSTSPCEAMRHAAKQSEFWAPEVESGEAPTAATDVYALGRTIRFVTQHCKIYEPTTSVYGIPKALFDIGQQCFEEEVDSRPIMSDVRKWIRRLL